MVRGPGRASLDGLDHVPPVFAGLANLADLESQQQEPAASQERRQRIFQSSAGYLQQGDRPPS